LARRCAVVWSSQVSTDLLRPYATMWNAAEKSGSLISISTTARPEPRSKRPVTCWSSRSSRACCRAAPLPPSSRPRKTIAIPIDFGFA